MEQKDPQDSIGTILKHYREEAGISITQIEEKLKISKRNILALEADNFSALPENLYTKNFIESYARYLGVSVPKILALYAQERSLLEKNTSEEAPKKSSLTITPTHIKVAAGILVALSLIIYLGFQIRQIFTPPELTILHPAEDIITNQSFVEVSGQTEPEAIVHINDKEISIDKDGIFATTLDLNRGLNIIKVSSKKKNSKENVLFREILVE